MLAFPALVLVPCNLALQHDAPCNHTTLHLDHCAPPFADSATEDFSAHAGNVNCVKLGQKSAGVVVTGGDDKKVNVWTIGKTQCGFVSGSVVASARHSAAFKWQRSSEPCGR